MDGIKFSFIMPTFNRYEYFKLSVQAIVNQTYKNIELIIVDDCSEKNQYKLKKNFIDKLNDDRVFLYRFDKNHGHCYARNYGVEHSTGEWVIYPDDDDQVDKYCCEKLLNYIDKNTEVITTKYLIVYDNGKIEEKGLDCSKVDIFENNQVDTCSFAHKRICYDKFGGWDLRYKRMADDEIIFRYVSKTKNYKFCDYQIAKFFIRKNIKRIMNVYPQIQYMRMLYNEFYQLYKGKAIVLTDLKIDVNQLHFDISYFIDFDIEKKINVLKAIQKYYNYNYLVIINNLYDECLNDLFFKIKNNNYVTKKGNIILKIKDENNLKNIIKGMIE